MAIPELEKERAIRALRRFCDKVPVEIRHQLLHDFRFVRSDIELFERRPHYLERHRHVEHVVAKFRYNAKRGSWTLFWSDRNLRWHAYDGLEDRRDFLELLREVENDPTCIFFG
jgi:nucleoid-associated protein YejK